MVNEPIDEGGGDDGIAEVVAEGFEVDVGGQKRGAFGVAGFDDFEKERGVAGRFLFEPVEAHLVNEQDIDGGIGFEFSLHGSVGQAGHEIFQHVGGGGVPAAVDALTTEQEQGHGDVAFAGAGFAGEDQALRPLDEGERGQFHDLCFIQARLKGKVEIHQELSGGEARFLDAPFDTPVDQLLGLDGNQTRQDLGDGSLLAGGAGKFLIEGFFEAREFE